MQKTIRHLAVHILTAVSQSGAFAGDLLDSALEERRLTQTADGRLLTHLVYGVLRMQGHLDWILAGLYRGKYAKMEEDIKNILRTGLYQLRFSERLPSFAVVDEAVKIAKKIAPAAGGLTNAVLRSYLRNIDKIAFPSLEKNPAEYIASFHSHPLWLVKTWLALYGPEETVNLCRANNELPSTTIRVNTLKISRPALEEKLKSEAFDCLPTVYSSDGLHLPDPPRPVQKTVFFQEGLLRLQDEAAQLTAYLVNPQSGENILDACAGSGGKTSHLAALIKNTGRIAAMDRNPVKLNQLQNDASRLGISIIEPLPADLLNPVPADFAENFDRVLVDAPCSGTGTLRRNPEIKWRLKNSDPDKLSTHQKIILQNAASAVKKGGTLIYCTCSMLPAENDEVIRHFLTENQHFTLLTPSGTIARNLIDHNGFFRTDPYRHRMDGFFGAVLQRRI